MNVITYLQGGRAFADQPIGGPRLRGTALRPRDEERVATVSARRERLSPSGPTRQTYDSGRQRPAYSIRPDARSLAATAARGLAAPAVVVPMRPDEVGRGERSRLEALWAAKYK